MKSMIDDKIPYIGNLLDNSSIPDVMLDAYYRLQPDQPEEVPDNYVGKKHRYNPPYQIRIGGVYPLMVDWCILEFKIEDGRYKQNVVDKYLRLFTEGFKLGYHNFEEDIIKKNNSLFNNDVNFIQKVFDYATAQGNAGGNFPEIRGTDEHVFSIWNKSGEQGGYFYRSWYLILENHKLFQSLFASPIPNVEISNAKKHYRERALAHIYKVECGEAEAIPRKDQRPKGYEKAFDSFNIKSKNREIGYKPPTEKELEMVITFLDAFPKAQQMAKDVLQKTIIANS